MQHTLLVDTIGKLIGRVLWPRKVSRKRFSLCMSWNWNIFMGTNTIKHAESKSEEFPLRRPAVFSQTAVLSTRMDEETRLHNSKWLIPVNQSPHITKDRFAWIILNYVILSSLDVNNIFWLQHWQDKEITFYNHLFWLLLYKITRTLMSSLWAMCLGWEIIAYMRWKRNIQQC